MFFAVDMILHAHFPYVKWAWGRFFFALLILSVGDPRIRQPRKRRPLKVHEILVVSFEKHRCRFVVSVANGTGRGKELRSLRRRLFAIRGGGGASDPPAATVPPKPSPPKKLAKKSRKSKFDGESFARDKDGNAFYTGRKDPAKTGLTGNAQPDVWGVQLMEQQRKKREAERKKRERDLRKTLTGSVRTAPKNAKAVPGQRKRGRISNQEKEALLGTQTRDLMEKWVDRAPASLEEELAEGL